MVRISVISILLILVFPFSVEPVRGTERTVTLAAVGDVFFCRGVEEQIEEKGIDYLFESTTEILSACDLAFCNLECVLSTRGTPMDKRFLFRADPSCANVLSTAGFDVVCVANNHTIDFGYEALLDTVNAVENAGMISVGTQIAESGDTGARFVERNGLTIGFLALSDFAYDSEKTPGGYPVVMLFDPDNLAGQVSEAKSRCDVLVVSMHWGVDYIPFFTERQQAIGEMCIDNGADLVLGHHPHVLQDVVLYEGKPIVYSMGGFVWDSSRSGANHSVIFVFKLGVDRAELIETIPVEIVDCQPVPGIS